jgi:peptidoglycan/xylan/chitin deacetylase (PgdA/CDA1 family)
MFKRLYRLKRLFKKSALILMYHRVADPVIDPWELAVGIENFEQQLQVLKKSYNVLPLPVIVQQLQKGRLRHRCLAITFDDGYIDNFTIAKPLLEGYQLPATFFITSRNIGLQKEFWWDDLEQLILQTEKLPGELSFQFNENDFYFNLSGETILTDELRQKHKGFTAYEPVSLRTRLYVELWKLFTPLEQQQQEQLLQQIRTWARGLEVVRPGYCSMSSEAIGQLASNQLFTIGGHTNSHPALAYHSGEVQCQEIFSNKLFLETITGTPVNLFAYPSGNYNDVTIETLKRTGYSAAFTTKARPVSRGIDFYQMNRFQVNNWSGLEFNHMLTRWFRH